MVKSANAEMILQNEQSSGFTDPLTGLGNRNRLREKVTQLAAERADDPAPFTLGVANLDGFRPINDLFGRDAGDEILCQVAHRLSACMPSGAIVTRMAVTSSPSFCRLSSSAMAPSGSARCSRKCFPPPTTWVTAMFGCPRPSASPSIPLRGRIFPIS